MLLVYGRLHYLELYGTAARIMMLHIIPMLSTQMPPVITKLIKQRIVSRDFAWSFFVIYKCFSIPCHIHALFGVPPTSEYWMIYRGPGFLPIVLFGSSPTPFPPLRSASCLSFSVFLCVAGRAYWREKRGDGLGDKPNHTTARKPGPL